MSLSAEQISHFVEHNWLKLDEAVPPSLCAEWVAAACAASSIDLQVRYIVHRCIADHFFLFISTQATAPYLAHRQSTRQS